MTAPTSSELQAGLSEHPEDEIVEAITHLAFYTGWPRAMSAITAAKNLFASEVAGERGEQRDG